MDQSNYENIRQRDNGKRKESDKSSASSARHSDTSHGLTQTKGMERKQVFSTRLDYILTILTLQTGCSTLGDLSIMVQKFNGLFILLPLFLLTIGVALPLMVQQTFCGFFTKYGYLKFWNMAPIGYGIGVTMVLFSLYECICWAAYAGLLTLHAIILPMRTENDWTTCKHLRTDSARLCFDATSIKPTQDCRKTTYPGFEFYRNITLQVHWSDDNAAVNWEWFACCIVIWVILSIMVSQGFRHIKAFIVKVPIIYLLFFTVLMTFSLYHHGMNDGPQNIFLRTDIPPSAAFFYLVSKVIHIPKLAVGTLNQLGSHAPRHVLIVTDAVITLLGSNVLIIVSIYFLFHCQGWVEENFKNIDFNCVATDGRMMLFASVPTVISSLPMGNVWVCLFFGMLALKTFLEIALVLTATINSVMDIFPHWNYHRAWIVSTVCAVGLILNLPFTMYPGPYLFDLIENDVDIVIDINIILIATLTIVYVYTIPRLLEDIHFMYGIPPVIFLKCAFYSCLVIIIPSTLYIDWLQLNDESWDNRPPTWARAFIGFSVLVISIPIPIFMLYFYLMHLKKHDVAALFKPTNLWGPPDMELRRERRAFHPWQTLRYKTNPPCTHNCLLGNARIRMEIEKREQQRREFFRTEIPNSIFEQWDDLYMWFHDAGTADKSEEASKATDNETQDEAPADSTLIDDAMMTSSEDEIKNKLLDLHQDLKDNVDNNRVMGHEDTEDELLHFQDNPHADIQMGDVHDPGEYESNMMTPNTSIDKSIFEPTRSIQRTQPTPPPTEPIAPAVRHKQEAPVHVKHARYSKSCQTESRLKRLRKMIRRVKLPWPLRRRKKRKQRCTGTNPIYMPSTAIAYRARESGRRSHDIEAISTSSATDYSDTP